MQMFSRATPQQRFWKWFAENSAPYRNFSPHDTNLNEIFDVLQEQLDKVADGFVFEFSGHVEGNREFILSADGDARVFPAVRALIDAAPSLSGWTFIAFRQRGDANVSVQVNDFELGPKQIFFRLARAGEKIDITLYIENLHALTDHQSGIASFLLLDNALGEEAVALRIGAIERAPLREHPRGEGLRPLNELPAAFDELLQ